MFYLNNLKFRKMKNLMIYTLCVIFNYTLLINPFSAQSNNHLKINTEFDGISIIDILTVSGNCKILKHDEQNVKVFLTNKYKPSKSLEPIVSTEENKLIIKEKINGSNFGHSEWTLMVPENVDIKITSAAGNIKLESIIGEIEVITASGNVNLTETTLENSKIISASGNINASEITILGDSKFISASGNVRIMLKANAQFNLLVSSASGNSTLDFNQHIISGNLEMKARVTKGKIRCPLKFENESEVIENNHQYMVKSRTIENSSPTFKIHTASGIAALKE